MLKNVDIGEAFTMTGEGASLMLKVWPSLGATADKLEGYCYVVTLDSGKLFSFREDIAVKIVKNIAINWSYE